MSNFVHLRLHSSYSLSEGAVKIDGLLDRCVTSKMPAVAITDSNNLFASLEFSLKAAKKGVQPIIGIILNIEPQIETDIHANKSIDTILLIAKNSEGYSNILKLASLVYLEPKDAQANCINFTDLSKYSAGIIALVGSPKDTVGRLFLEHKDKLAEEYLAKLSDIFADHLYIELMRHGLSEEKFIEPKLIEAGLKNHIPFVATNDVFFLDRGMHEAHEVLLCISDGKYISQDDRRKSTPEHYFKTADEMAQLFSDIPEAIENTVNIAKRCSFMPEENEIIFPDYKVTLGKNQEDELCIIAKQGLEKKLLDSASLENWSEEEIEKKRQIYFDRLNFELDVITGMKFSGYFLIVSDFIKWSKRNNIPVGPGRGSGGASVVAWSLEITEIDPIKFGLLFERFLNPERISMPDFDIDFCQERRDEVIQYVRSKYGESKVAQIITFGKLQARAVVRDVGRVLQMPYSQVDRISKMIPFNPVNPVTLAQAIEMEPELKSARSTDEEVARMLDISLKLEGLNRHASTHAAGIVISNKDLMETAPLYKDHKSSMPAIQYSMKYAEAAGLIKFDFLGLKTLTVISKAVDLINKVKPDFDISAIPLDDKKTFEMLGRGDSAGVFQFESSGMRDALRKMKPDTIRDINALGALYRPGPMENIPTYIACKHGRQQPNYLHPKLKPILEETFGVIIYQEQVLEIARVLAGYTLGAADLLRKAMGKKIKAEMDAQREIFVKGAVANGVKEDEAAYIFDLVAKFAGYGFNKAHATEYGLISYQTAYLKSNYPAEMLVALLNNDIDDTDKINFFIDDAKYLGIEIIRPDINKSQAHFSIKYENGVGKIIYGLAALKNVGLVAMEELVAEREKNGLFKDIFEFARRSGNKIINKRQLESLIKAGCFDVLEKNRKKLFESIQILTNYHVSHQDTINHNQISLFSDKEDSSIHPKLVEVNDWLNRERLNNECSAFGFYLDEHPLSVYKELFRSRDIVDAHYIKEEMPESYATVKIAAIPISVKTRVSPKGRYVSCLMSTPTGILDVAIFDDKLLGKNRDFLYDKVPLFIMADVKKDDGGARLSARSIKELKEYFAENESSIYIKLINKQGVKSLIKLLKGKEDSSGLSVKLSVAINNKIIELSLATKYKFDISDINHNSLPEGIEFITQI